MEIERYHVRGDTGCKECCCGGPEKCDRKECDGLVHKEVSDEVEIDGEDGWEWVHSYKCDKCDYEQLFENDIFHRIKFN